MCELCSMQRVSFYCNTMCQTIFVGVQTQCDVWFSALYKYSYLLTYLQESNCIDMLLNTGLSGVDTFVKHFSEVAAL